MTEPLADELAAMIDLSDEALWQATTPTFTKEQQERLARLNDLADDRPLTAREKTEQTELLFAYEQSVLRHAVRLDSRLLFLYLLPAWPLPSVRLPFKCCYGMTISSLAESIAHRYANHKTVLGADRVRCTGQR